MEAKRVAFVENRVLLFVDLRKQRIWQPVDLRDICVENESAAIFDQHVSEGFYTRSIMFHGISRLKKIRGLSSPNCVDTSYTNVFTYDRQGLYHVFILSPL